MSSRYSSIKGAGLSGNSLIRNPYDLPLTNILSLLLGITTKYFPGVTSTSIVMVDACLFVILESVTSFKVITSVSESMGESKAPTKASLVSMTSIITDWSAPCVGHDGQPVHVGNIGQAGHVEQSVHVGGQSGHVPPAGHAGVGHVSHVGQAVDVGIVGQGVVTGVEIVGQGVVSGVGPVGQGVVAEDELLTILMIRLWSSPLMSGIVQRYCPSGEVAPFLLWRRINWLPLFL